MRDIVKHITIMTIIIVLAAGVNTLILSKQISNMKQDIVEIKKDYSYDPKNAK